MRDRAALEAELRRIDGRPYPAYRDLGGAWELGRCRLTVDHVQGDPFAAPSRIRLSAPTDLPDELLTDADAREAAEDWLLRRFARGLPSARRGSGRSGELDVYHPGPEICERSALRLRADGTAEVRMAVGLPANGRRIRGREAAELLLRVLPEATALLAHGPGLDGHVASVRTQRALRRSLADHGLVAFVADGAILPRASGVSTRPLAGAVPCVAPPSLAVELPGPDGPIRGLGIRAGVTLITGGGFHGKSTVLAALQSGHLDFVPGDGRERVVSVPRAVKVRAEDGRRVWEVDISAFLRDLPGGQSTTAFCTEDASGSTSQAAAIVEAVESGAEVLLIDEDTSATNLLVRDDRMRALIGRDREPITPFVERVRQLYEVWGVSTVMVVGGVGDYLAVADTVIGMDAWRPVDLTARARELAGPPVAAPGPLAPLRPRVPAAPSVAPTGPRRDRVRARDARRVQVGDQDVDLVAVEQVLDAAHAATVGHALRFARAHLTDGRRDVRQVLDALDAILDDEGVEALSPRNHPDGTLVRPRRHEIAAALSRAPG